MSLDLLRVVAARNAAAFWDDGALDQSLREGVPAEMWRALK